jgi:hypothetical protein
VNVFISVSQEPVRSMNHVSEQPEVATAGFSFSGLFAFYYRFFWYR